MTTNNKYLITALYHFVRIDDPAMLKGELEAFLTANDIKGTILVAPEGINGTVSGSETAIAALHRYLRSDPRFESLETKESWHEDVPFHRTKVRLKKEIVTMGVEGIDPSSQAGKYLRPSEWNDLLDQEDVVVIDTRNDYEYQIGTFKGALNPKTTSFRELPSFLDEHLEQMKGKKIAMFCTGGIRCEKSTSYLTSKGFDEVYHLQGGILKYLEEIPVEQSKWQGECFVFDGRVAVDHTLEKGIYEQCFACRMPLSPEEMKDSRYEHGISCPHCFDAHSDEQKARHAEREKQMRIAEELGICHIGGQQKAA